MIRAIFDHLVERGDDADEIVDYIAGMTDRFALAYADRSGRREEALGPTTKYVASTERKKSSARSISASPSAFAPAASRLSPATRRA